MLLVVAVVLVVVVVCYCWDKTSKYLQSTDFTGEGKTFLTFNGSKWRKNCIQVILGHFYCSSHTEILTHYKCVLKEIEGFVPTAVISIIITVQYQYREPFLYSAVVL